LGNVEKRKIGGPPAYGGRLDTEGPSECLRLGRTKLIRKLANGGGNLEGVPVGKAWSKSVGEIPPKNGQAMGQKLRVGEWNRRKGTQDGGNSLINLKGAGGTDPINERG
jgi:hypothetical protein